MQFPPLYCIIVYILYKSGETTLKRLHIFNPVAGGGHSPELLTKGAANGEETYVTSGIGDAERFVYEICRSRSEVHFVVYGGDGTVNEAANGIIRAGAGQRTLLSVVPTGTGNDFVRSFPEKDAVRQIDAMRYRFFRGGSSQTKPEERYAVNIINFGFDSRVVRKTDFYKKIFPGSAAYIAGVADTFCRKIGENWQVELEYDNGETEKFESRFTLALAANCQYYGGGFRSASLADPSDGRIDFIAVKKVARTTFIRLIGDYKKGTHLDPVTGRPLGKFDRYMIYRKCRKINISGISDLCSDGEIEKASAIEISAVPGVLRIAT